MTKEKQRIRDVIDTSMAVVYAERLEDFCDCDAYEDPNDTYVAPYETDFLCAPASVLNKLKKTAIACEITLGALLELKKSSAVSITHLKSERIYVVLAVKSHVVTSKIYVEVASLPDLIPLGWYPISIFNVHGSEVPAQVSDASDAEGSV